MRLASLYLIIALIAPSVVHGRVWRVEVDGSGDAPSIQAGVDSAKVGDTVLLGPGTYLRSEHAGSSHSMVVLKSGITLRGEAGPEATILDPNFRSRGILVPSESEAVHIDGLTIQNGQPSPGAFLFGGGICADAFTSDVVISNCIIQGNRIVENQLGGGIFCWDATVQDCKILNNQGGLDASGIGIWANDATIERCEVSGNSVIGDAGAGGAGIRLVSSGTISDCLILENSVRGVFGSGAGGISAINSTIVRCFFARNRVLVSDAGAGGSAIHVTNSIVQDCVFLNNEVISNSSVANGTVRAWTNSRVINCAIVGNRAIAPTGQRATVGAALSDGSELRSSIIAFNEGEATASFGEPATLYCNNVYGNTEDNLAGIDGGGNFSRDPEFCAVDPVGTMNVSIQQDSPCASGNHPDGTACGKIGAGEVECGPVGVETRTWSQIKEMYRRR